MKERERAARVRAIGAPAPRRHKCMCQEERGRRRGEEAVHQ